MCSLDACCAQCISGELHYDDPRATLARILQQEDINFLLTNRIPRRLLTHLIGWFSRIEHPWLRAPASRSGGCFPISICRKRSRRDSEPA